MHTMFLLLVLLTTAAIGDQNGSPLRHQAEDVNKEDENYPIANVPRHVNLNDKIERDSFHDFVMGTCEVWNQYIPYCSGCASPM